MSWSCQLPRVILRCSKSTREGRRSQGHLDGCLAASHLWREEMPSERPYPGQLWKHDSMRVLVVAVHLNTVTYELLHAPTSPGAIELFLNEKLDAAAGVRQQLLAFAKTHPNVRVLEGRFMAIEQAMGTPKGRVAGTRYLRQFVEEMKVSGFVAEALARSGQGDATVAPPWPPQ